MTARRSLSPQQADKLAAIAAERGVCIVVEAGGRVYRFQPADAPYPIGSTEREDSACDAAFGLSG